MTENTRLDDLDVKLPTFPVHALPSWLAEYVKALAEEKQTPLDLPGVIVLGVLAACAGGRAVVEVRTGWREPTNLYAVVVADPGHRKSPPVAAAVKPLLDVEALLTERAAAQIVEAEILRDIETRTADRHRASAARATDEEARNRAKADAVGAAMAAEAITVPTLPRLFADDVTPEALGTLLADNGGRMAILSAEGGIFDVFAGRYSSVPNLDPLLKGHAGDTIRVDRKGRRPEFVRFPALTMVLAVQPEVLQTIGANRSFRGRGLLARKVLTAEPYGADGEDLAELFRELADLGLDVSVSARSPYYPGWTVMILMRRKPPTPTGSTRRRGPDGGNPRPMVESSRSVSGQDRRERGHVPRLCPLPCAEVVLKHCRRPVRPVE
jgi:Protein of unknown function (DUF3987)